MPGRGPKCLRWTTSCTVSLMSWDMLSLGKADSTSLERCQFCHLLSSFPIFLNENPDGLWCSYALSSTQPGMESNGAPMRTVCSSNIFQHKIQSVLITLKEKHFYNDKLYIARGYLFVPDIKFYRNDLSNPPLWRWFPPVNSLPSSITQHKKRTNRKKTTYCTHF